MIVGGRISQAMRLGSQRGLGLALLLVLLLPAAALLPAAVLDRGPDGEMRAGPFPLALALSDPYLWDCARNSLAASIAIAALALVIGVALARLLVRGRPRGAGGLRALILAPLAVPPAFGAVGLAFWLERTGRTPSWSGWAIWIASAVAQGVPLVVLAAEAALGRLDPDAEAIARASGATRRAIWRKLIWPAIRPDAAGAGSIVFGLSLFDPGPALVLGLRRTLPVQAVEATLAGDQANRAAFLALEAIALAAVVRVLLRWWGGRAPALPDLPPWPAPRRGVRVASATIGLVVLAWSAVALAPAAGLLASLAEAPRPGPEGTAAALPAWPALDDPEMLGLLARSLLVGVGAVGLARVAAGALGRSGRSRALAAWFESTPPLAVGIGIALLAGGWPGFTDRAGWLDPIRTPGLALVLASAAVQWPRLARASAVGAGRARPELADLARGLGGSTAPARWEAGRSVAAAGWLGAAVAATAVAPAWVLAPTSEGRTLGAAAVVAAAEPGGGRRAAALACAAIGLNALALARAGRSGSSGPPADWLVGRASGRRQAPNQSQ